MIALLLASLASTPAPYPAEQVLAAFGQVCRNLVDLGETEAEAKAAGWSPFEPDEASPIGELVAFGMSEGEKVAETEGGSMSPMQVLRRKVEGEELVVVLSGARKDGVTVNGCRVFDVGEPRQITPAQAERWTGRAPSRVDDDPEISIASWEPGYASGHDSFEIYFIPANSPAINLVKVSGVVLKADLVGAQK